MPLKKLLSICILSFLSYTATAQPGMSWIRCFGGSQYDGYSNNALTRGGNLISIGQVASTNGDGTGNHGMRDVMLTCTNPQGQVVWHKVIGGTQEDGWLGTAVDTLIDGNILIAFASSSNDGDVSGNHGNHDMVFKKYSVTGNLIWSKTYGGNLGETVTELKATPDGGAICIGVSNSHNSGDVGPNHNAGTNDIWVVKLDAAGNIQWQKLYGGSGSEEAGDICLAPGGGYYITGIAPLPLDGDLAGLLPGGTVTGQDEVFIARINATGTIQWAQLRGGNNREQAPYLGVIGTSLYLTFASFSNDRDVQSFVDGSEVCLIKYMADTVEWRKTYTGIGLQYASGVVPAKNRGIFYLPGISFSSSFAGYSFPNPGGECQALFMTIDTAFGILSALRTYGGSGRDFATGVQVASNGDLLVSGTTYSNDFEMHGNHGDADGYITVMPPANFISGNVYIDRNNNNVFDPAFDSRISFMPIEVSKNNQVVANTLTYSAAFYVEVDTGLYTTKIKPYNPSYYTSVPTSFNSNFTTSYQSSSQNIKLIPTPGIRDIRVFTFPTDVIRPNYHTRYILLGQNIGTDTVPAGTISWKKDSRFTITGYSIPPASVIGDSITWNYSNFKPFDSLKIYIDVATPIPPQLNAGDTVQVTARILPVAGDVAPADNVMTSRTIVIGPLDPNDKTNSNGNKMTLSQLQSGTFINYLIRFQNVGTAPAFNVIIKDTIRSTIQLSTLETIAASHPFRVTQKNGIVEWQFIGINLPDSNANEPGSHGFVAFRVKPVSTLQVNDSVVNKAGIYFDYNDAVVTNESVVKIINTEVITSLPPVDINDKTIVVYPNPVRGTDIHVHNKDNTQRVQSWRLINLQGQIVARGTLSSTQPRFRIVLPGQFSSGNFILEIITNKKVVYKQVQLIQ